MTDQKIIIKSWLTGGVLFETTAVDLRAAVEQAVAAGASLNYANLDYARLNHASLNYANLDYANLDYANLNHASLDYANLNHASINHANLDYARLNHARLNHASLNHANLDYANLNYANLDYASLNHASLNHANLDYANLNYARGISQWRTTPLLMLLDQPGPIRAYKMVDNRLRSPIQATGKITYEIGAEFSVNDANTDVDKDCGAGINLATFDWCARNWREGRRILVAEFTAADIAAIPTASDGKFRVHRCRIVSEITDLASRGLGEPVAETAAGS